MGGSLTGMHDPLISWLEIFFRYRAAWYLWPCSSFLLKPLTVKALWGSQTCTLVLRLVELPAVWNNHAWLSWVGWLADWRFLLRLHGIWFRPSPEWATQRWSVGVLVGTKTSLSPVKLGWLRLQNWFFHRLFLAFHGHRSFVFGSLYVHIVLVILSQAIFRHQPYRPIFTSYLHFLLLTSAIAATGKVRSKNLRLAWCRLNSGLPQTFGQIDIDGVTSL